MSYQIELFDNIERIGHDQWDRLVSHDYPFSQYAFLHALEKSESVSAQRGWQPVHIAIKDNGIIIAALPLYLKNHSYGEYVFDWAWADAYQRYGLDYFPKLVSAIPFSPVAGPRLITQHANESELWELINAAIPSICNHLKANSWHLLYPCEKKLSVSKQTPAFESNQLMVRKGCQYQWFNQGYSSFEAFLDTFTSRKRKNVRKERLKIQQAGIRHRWIEGKDITADERTAFFDFYRMTYLKRGREAYLSPEFFEYLFHTMPDNLLLVMAEKENKAVAAALSLKDSDTLYGRYWGCFDEYDSLHFETCYYQGIDYCIEHGLKRFDSGAQGEHKIQRGFQPVPTWSVHWLKDAGFNQAIQNFIDEETQAVNLQIDNLNAYLPFKQI